MPGRQEDQILSSDIKIKVMAMSAVFCVSSDISLFQGKTTSEPTACQLIRKAFISLFVYSLLPLSHDGTPVKFNGVTCSENATHHFNNANCCDHFLHFNLTHVCVNKDK